MNAVDQVLRLVSIRKMQKRDQVRITSLTPSLKLSQIAILAEHDFIKHLNQATFAKFEEKVLSIILFANAYYINSRLLYLIHFIDQL